MFAAPYNETRTAAITRCQTLSTHYDMVLLTHIA